MSSRALPESRVTAHSHDENGNGHSSSQLSESPAMLPNQSIVGIIWRYRYRSTAFVIGTMTLVVIGLFVCPRKYTSSAKLFVRIGRESVTLDPIVTTGQVMGVETTREAEINSLLEVASSRRILETVVDELSLVPSSAEPIERERAIIDLDEDLSIWSPKRSSVIGIEYESSSPEKAQQVVAKVVEAFQDEHLRVNSTPGSYEFFEQQTLSVEQELTDAHKELRDAKTEFRISSIDGRRDTLQEQIGEVEKKIFESQTELYAVRARLDLLQNGLDSLPDLVVRQFIDGLPADADSNMRRQLYDLQVREQELLSRFTEDHPQVIAVREQVREAALILAAEQPDRDQSLSAVMLTDLAAREAYQGRLVSLEQQAEELYDALATLNAQEMIVLELERKVRLLEEKYTNYVQNLEQARIDRELKKDEITNIRIIDDASFVVKPSSPRKGITLMMAMAFAIFGGIALSFVSDSFANGGRQQHPMTSRNGDSPER